ncbi:hypothetical protein PIIN_02094 [Serendipita indica DSM 11827]|uniref:F-box domain-containing protein n=1 Tax=Serendipita indica (strain DSM 11827) TaxID=1109443 RepID=G4TA64_SERID|nr:hypothetical protein PIIN_02094 [Serendipita indica DSM 11827]
MSQASLPVEIWIRILCNLPCNTLLGLKQVSKTFYHLIETDPRVQYALQLDMAGCEDVGSSGKPIQDRLNYLKSIETSFKTGSLLTKAWIPINGGTRAYELQGGVYAQERHCEDGNSQKSGINVCRLPSLLHPGASWSLPDFEYWLTDFTLNPHDDLLVTVEKSRSSFDRPWIILRFLSLTDGYRHQQSYGPVRIQSDHCDSRQHFIIHIMGDFVGLLTLKWHFFIVNWKTGTFHTRSDHDPKDPIHDFFFLDNTRFVLVRGQREPPEFEIYSFHHSGDDRSQPTLLAVYHLPRTVEPVQNITCRIDPPSFLPRSPGGGSQTKFGHLPFYPRLEDRAIVVCIDVNMHGSSMSYTLVTRASSLFKVRNGVKSEARGSNGEEIPVVEGKLWMKETFFIHGGLANNYSCHVYGSRFLLLHSTQLDENEASPGGNDTRIYDYALTIADVNPVMVAWVRSRLASRGDPVLAPPFDEDEIRQRMQQDQYRVINSNPVKTRCCVEEGWTGELSIALTTLSLPRESVVGMIDGERVLTIRKDADWRERGRTGALHIHTHELNRTPTIG